MSKMENNTVNKAGSTGVELNLNDGTQRYQVTKKDLKKTADRYNFMACNIFNYESQMGPAVHGQWHRYFVRSIKKMKNTKRH